MPVKSEISFVRSLADKRTRDEHSLFVVEGPKMVAEALTSGWTVKKVYGISEMMRDLPHKPDTVFEDISLRELERMSSLRTPQGVLAVVECMPARGNNFILNNNTVGKGLTLALDGIQDPGNLGTIMRTADWFGVRRILCSPDCADRFNPKAVQASMGAIFRIPVSCGELTFPSGVPVYGAFLDGESIYSSHLSPDGIIVLGSEGRGISAAVADHVTHRITIPSYSPRAESLNVAAAAAIICSEMRARTERS